MPRPSHHQPAMTSALPLAASLCATATSCWQRATSSSREARASATCRSHSSTRCFCRSSRAATLWQAGVGVRHVTMTRQQNTRLLLRGRCFSSSTQHGPPGLLVPQRCLPAAERVARLLQRCLPCGSRLPEASHHCVHPLKLCIPLLQQLNGGEARVAHEALGRGICSGKRAAMAC